MKKILPLLCTLFLLCNTFNNAFSQTCSSVADFKYNMAGGCNGKVIFVDQSSGNIVKYAWDFGDPAAGDFNTSSDKNPNHEFNAFGLSTGSQTFAVKLTVTDVSGCTSTKVMNITVGNMPDPTIADATTTDTPFMNCGTATNSSYKLTVVNMSTTKDSNVGYTINWGDGSTQTLPASYTTATHTYTTLGKFILSVSALGGRNGNCVGTKYYTVINSRTPSFSISKPASTTACLTPEAPSVTYSFPLSNYQGNTAGTKYTFSFDDGSAPYEFTQETLPAAITHTFTSSSCSKPNGAFTLTGTAENECGTSPVAKATGIVISKQAIPNFTFSTGKLNICVGETVYFTNTTSKEQNCSVTYAGSISPAQGWTLVSLDENWENASVKFSTPGEYDVSLMVSTPNCGSRVVTKKFVVLPPPVASFSTPANATSFCKNTDVAMTNSSTNAIGYSWAVSPATNYTLSSGTLTSSNPTFRFSKEGTYTITLTTKSNNCYDTQTSKQITIKGEPTAVLPASQSYCGPQTLTFNGTDSKHKPVFNSNGGSINAYTWAVDKDASFTGGTSASSASPNISFPSAGTYTIKLSVRNECGTSTETEQLVTIFAIPAAPQLASATICTGNSATLEVTAPEAGLTYNWYTVATGGTAFHAGNTYAKSNYTSNSTYYVEAFSSNGCISSERTAVAITVTPAISNNSISGNQTTCSGATPVTLTGSQPAGGSGNYTYQWEVSQNGTDFSTATGTSDELNYKPSSALTQDTWFRRKVSSGTCQESVSAEVKVTVAPLPDAPIVTNTAICSGATAQLTVSNAAAGITYKWYNAGGLELATGISYTTPALQATTSYFVQAFTTSQCTSGRTEATVTVTPALAAGSISTPKATICTDTSPGKLTGSAATGGNGNYTYQWYSSTTSSTAGFAEISQATAADYTAESLSATTWFKRVASSGECTAESNVVKVNVEALPAAPVVAGTVSICSGSSTTLSVTASSGYTYRWYSSNGSQVHTGTTFATSALSASTSFFVEAESASGCISLKTEVAVSVTPALVNTVAVAKASICEGEAPGTIGGSLTGGNGTYTIVWEQKTGNNTFTAAPGDNAQADYTPGVLYQTTTFRRKVSSGSCSSVSNEVTINVTPAIASNSIQGSQSICPGSTPSTLTGNGASTYSYQWYSSTNSVDFSAIANATSKDYTPTAPAQTTWFKRTIVSGECTAESNVIKVEVTSLPTAPQVVGTTTICSGSTTTLTASGNGNTYKWYKEDNLAFTGATFTTPALVANTTYTVVAVNETGCEGTAATVTISVVPPVANNTISGNQTICNGNVAATLTGSEPTGGAGAYTYLWEVSTNGTDFTAAPGTNNTQDYNPSSSFTQNTWFRRKVKGQFCQESVSGLIKITVAPLPAAPVVANASVCAGAGVTLSVENVSDGVSYKWYTSSTSGQAIHTSSNFNTPALNASTSYYVEAVASGATACTSNRTEVVVTVTPPLTAGDQITAPVAAVCKGTAPGTITGETPTGGNGNYTYQWYASKTGATAGFNAIPNATGANYTSAAVNETTWFKRTVTSGKCTIESSAEKIEVVDAPVAPVVANASICANQTASLTVTSSIQNLTYKWYNTAGSLVNTGTAFETPALSTSTTYTVVAQNSTGCESASTTVSVIVIPAVANNTISGEQTICSGSTSATLTGSTPTGGNGNFTYLWEASQNGTDFADAAGTNNEQHYTPLGAVTQNMWFRRTVRSANCQQVSSNTIKITVASALEAPVVANATVCEGATATLQVTSPANGVVYKWYSNSGTLLETATTFTTPALSATTTYYAEASSTGTANCASSRTEVTVTVNPALAGGTVTSPQAEICSGTTPGTLLGEAPRGGNGSYTYQWLASTSSATTGFTLVASTETYTPEALNQNTWFKRIVTSGECESESNVVQVAVEQQPIAPTIAGTTEICQGSSTILTVSNSGGTHRWFNAAGELVYTGTSFTTPALSSTTSYTVETENATGCISPRAEATVTVTPALTNTITASTPILCQGGNAGTIEGNLVGGDGTYTILWEQRIGNGNFEPATGTNTAEAYAPGTLQQTTTFRRKVSSASCETVSNEVTITVTPGIASNSISGNQTICLGTEAAVLVGDGNNNFTYQWFASTEGNSTGFTAIGAATAKDYAPGNLSQTTWFKREISTGSCETGSNVVKVEVITLPATPQVSGLTSICSGSSTTLTATATEDTYNWYNTAGNLLHIGQAFTTPVLTVSVTYFVEAVNSNGCISSERTAVAVTVTPAISSNSISGNQTICNGAAAAALTGTTPNGGSGDYTYLWESSQNGIDFSTATGTTDELNYTPSAALIQDTWFRRKVTSAGCQENVSNVVKVTVAPSPQAPVVANASICYSASTELSVSSPSGNTTYTWYNATGAVVGTGTRFTTQGLTTSTSYFVAATTNCTSSKTEVIVTVNPALAGGTITATETAVCVGTAPGTITGDDVSSEDLTYQWFASTTGSPNDFVSISGATAKDYKPTALTQTTWFKREVKDGTCSAASNIVKIETEMLPAAPQISGTTTTCSGGSATLTATASSIYTYKWYSETGDLLYTGDTFTAANLTATSTYYVEATSATGCTSDRTEVTVTVTPPLANNSISGEQIICSGSTPTTITGTKPTDGGGAYTYVWEISQNGTDYTAAPGTNNAQNYNPTGSFVQDTWFRRKASGATCQEAVSNVVKVTVVTAPAAPVVANAAACSGGSVTLSVEDANEAYTYNWYSSNSSSTVLATGTAYTIESLTVTTTLYVEAVLAGESVCTSNRSAVTATVLPELVAGNITTPEAAVCEGGSPGTLTGAKPSGGRGVYTYEWFASTTSATTGFESVTDTVSQSYTPTSLNQTTWFKRVVYSEEGCTAESNVIKIEVTPTPVAPVAADATTCAGQTASLAVANPAQGLSYKWYNTSGHLLHTGATYETAVLNADATYYVEAVNALGCAGPKAAVNVTIAPAISNSIAASMATICTGGTAGEVTGSISGGNGSYSIVWEQRTGNEAFAAAAGTNDQQHYTPTALVQTTTFRRVVSSGGCTSISNEVTIEVGSTLANNTISGDQTLCGTGTPAELTGNGDANYSYQWYASTESSITGFTVVEGATAQDYTPAALSTSTWFRREVRTGTCEAMSNTVFVEVQPVLANNSISYTDGAVCAGAIPNMISGSEPTGGSGAYTYEWQWAQADDATNFNPAPGTNDEQSYTFSSPVTEPVLFRRIARSGACQQLVSEVVEIEVVPGITNEISTASTSLCENSVPSRFTSSKPIDGDVSSLTFRWERSLDGGEFETVASTEEYEPTEALALGTWTYRRVITTGNCGEMFSNTVTITVAPAIADNVLKAVAPVCVGTNFTLSSDSPANSSYNYQWLMSSDGTSFTEIAGATEASYTTSISERTWFKRVVTTATCTSTSEAIELQLAQPLVNTIAGNQEICVGATAEALTTATLSGGNGDYSFQWEKSETGANGTYTAIAGATEADYQPEALNKTTWFRRKVTGGTCDALYSNVVEIKLRKPIVNQLAGAQTICAGATAATLGSTSAKAGNDNQYTFQWQSSSDGSDFSNIQGATAASYSPGNLSNSTWFRRMAHTGGCSQESNVVEVKVVQPIASNSIATTSAEVCYNTAPAPVTGDTPADTVQTYTFRWEMSLNGTSFTTIASADKADYQPAALQQTTWFRRVIVSDLCGELASNEVKIEVVPNDPIQNNTIAASNQSICGGQLATLTGAAPTGASGKYTYLWLMSTESANAGFAPASGTNNTIDYQSTALSQTTWFKRVVSSGDCHESTSAAVKIDVLPQPALPTVADVSTCPGSSVTFTATVAANVTVEWYDATQGGNKLFTGTSFTTPALSASTSYYVQTINENNCSSASRLEVKAIVVMPKAIVSGDVTIQEGESVQLEAQGGVSYSWSPAEGLSDANSATPTASPTKTTTYKVTVTTAEGCTAEAEVTVTVLYSVIPANVITANGDDHNDKFIIKNIEYYPSCSVEIYNRWGEKVFESKGYKEAWNGTKNGKALPVAAYYYIIRLTDQDKPISGSVTLVK
ncbi:gliding motility-associated C-terminal domain-containing protein [Pontibacter harenae]|uniref:Ig-like domain-containing protein n=1 Tax=Pontibacter harenae TaxID=2894083 RepID=UPI001E3D21D2|nr:gliding motility-associated C-terminal domain-containing protein [Pontibacter harenae]MCC9166100.1 gliding motility-associated C-terminal domain-containing protein [Pontibacter harenae]